MATQTRIISKTTKGISTATILIVIVWLYFSWWSSSWANAIPLIASLGGVVVFIGLVIEKEAEDAKESPTHESLTDDEKHLLHKKMEVGWMVLMVGIGMEIVLGGGIAAHDVWESNKNDPLKKPMASASARARIVFKLDKAPQNADPSIIFKSPEESSWITSIGFIKGTNSLLQLSSPASGPSGIWNMGSTDRKSCEIAFGANPWGFINPDPKRENIPVEAFGQVDEIIMQIRPLATNISVQSGNVVLIVNDIKWEFEIPPQRPKWGAIAIQKVKSSFGKTEWRVPRIRVIDPFNRPEYTNLWYDGK